MSCPGALPEVAHEVEQVDLRDATAGAFRCVRDTSITSIAGVEGEGEGGGKKVPRCVCVCVWRDA